MKYLVAVLAIAVLMFSGCEQENPVAPVDHSSDVVLTCGVERNSVIIPRNPLEDQYYFFSNITDRTHPNWLGGGQYGPYSTYGGALFQGHLFCNKLP